MAPEMEPMMPDAGAINSSDLSDLAMDLSVKSAYLSGALSPATASIIECHMRVINSYYSNLIEGNSTLPRDIRAAMAGDYSQDPAKRDRQKESLAHIFVQDKLAEECQAPFWSSDFFVWLHTEFYGRLPESLKVVRSPGGRELRIEPGRFRHGDQNVTVGNHAAPDPMDLDRLMKRFFSAYNPERLKGHNRVIAAMASHHRFLWIHPFPDGNGRVVRLFTDRFLREVGLTTSGIWCLSRGLARSNADYKLALARADYARQGAHDGRGALSQRSLVAFCEFMFKVAIDQVEYMTETLALEGMLGRIRAYIDDRNKGLIPGMKPIKTEASRLLERAFMLGEFPRSEMAEISGLSQPTAKKLVQQMKEEGLLAEQTHRSPLAWAIPEHAERYYFPGLV